MTHAAAAVRATLDAASFRQIADIAHRDAGLAIPETKSAMVHTRLARRLRHLGLSTYDAYCQFLETPGGRGERREMISALTTNVSYFFRENHHFDRLQDDVFPALRRQLDAGGRVRLWSAGCSNGQEPFSIAIALHEAGLLDRGDVKILATDIDPKVIAHARAGAFPDHMVGGLSDAQRAAYFDCETGNAPPVWTVKPGLRDHITFRELNLLGPWPMRGRFDVIFCRNVVIYFDDQTQVALWARFAAAMEPGGWLFLGHSERVAGPDAAAFESVGMTAYRHVAAGPKGGHHGAA